jgi:hypothetical protein
VRRWWYSTRDDITNHCDISVFVIWSGQLLSTEEDEDRIAMPQKSGSINAFVLALHQRLRHVGATLILL